MESAKYDICLTFRYSFFRFFTDTDPDFPDTDFPDTDPDFPNPIPDLFAGPDPDSGKKSPIRIRTTCNTFKILNLL